MSEVAREESSYLGFAMISYTDSLQGITPDMLAGFFEGWSNAPSPKTHLRILHGSYAVELALDENRVVGFVNAISDGQFMAFLPLLEVLPQYRGQGVGRELVQRMTEQLSQLYAIDLVCDADLQPYYERLGWRATQGMSIRNYKNQSGT